MFPFPPCLKFDKCLEHTTTLSAPVCRQFWAEFLKVKVTRVKVTGLESGPAFMLVKA